MMSTTPLGSQRTQLRVPNSDVGVETCCGFVFGSLNTGAPPLNEYLGRARHYLTLMCERAPAGRIVFFDDLAENIEGARAGGIAAIHVKSAADVASALEALGI